jgi:hypothetical protein
MSATPNRRRPVLRQPECDGLADPRLLPVMTTIFPYKRILLSSWRILSGSDCYLATLSPSG